MFVKNYLNKKVKKNYSNGKVLGFTSKEGYKLKSKIMFYEIIKSFIYKGNAIASHHILTYSNGGCKTINSSSNM